MTRKVIIVKFQRHPGHGTKIFELLETVDQANEHRKRNRACAAERKAIETTDQANEHRKCTRTCVADKRVVKSTYQANGHGNKAKLVVLRLPVLQINECVQDHHYLWC